jgi:hypothetical protein
MPGTTSTTGPNARAAPATGIPAARRVAAVHGTGITAASGAAGAVRS